MLDRLPYEIFKQIVQYSTSRRELSSFRDTIGRISLPPIEASHVCRSWREALLSDPTMWTYFIVPTNDKDKGRTEELLLRSGSASLDVFIETINQELDTHALASVLQETHRFRVLEVDVYARRDAMQRLVYQILSCLKHPAPRLEYLSFQVFGMKLFLDEDFPRTPLNAVTPSLRHIHLYLSSGFEALVSSSLFQNLSEIHLQVCDTTLIHWDTLLDALELSPRLRILDIVSSSSEPTVSLSTFSRRRQVHLPHLQRLSFEAHYCRPGVVVANFVFRYLNFPLENIEFYIRIRRFHSKIFDVEPLSQLLVQQRYTKLLLMFSTRKKVDVSLIDPINDRSFITTFDNTHQPVDHLPDFLRIFVLSGISYLCLGYAPFKPTMLTNLFASLENLEHLHIDHGSPSTFSDVSDSPHISFLIALMPPPTLPSQTNADDDGFQSNNSTILCPSLHTLEIELDPDDEFELDESYAKLVSRCADYRRQAGRPFKAIKILTVESMLREEALVHLRPHEGFSFTDLTDDWREAEQIANGLMN